MDQGKIIATANHQKKVFKANHFLWVLKSQFSPPALSFSNVKRVKM